MAARPACLTFFLGLRPDEHPARDTPKRRWQVVRHSDHGQSKAAHCATPEADCPFVDVQPPARNRTLAGYGVMLRDCGYPNRRSDRHRPTSVAPTLKALHLPPATPPSRSCPASAATPTAGAQGLSRRWADSLPNAGGCSFTLHVLASFSRPSGRFVRGGCLQPSVTNSLRDSSEGGILFCASLFLLYLGGKP